MLKARLQAVTVLPQPGVAEVTAKNCRPALSISCRPGSAAYRHICLSALAAPVGHDSRGFEVGRVERNVCDLRVDYRADS